MRDLKEIELLLKIIKFKDYSGEIVFFVNGNKYSTLENATLEINNLIEGSLMS